LIDGDRSAQRNRVSLEGLAGALPGGQPGLNSMRSGRFWLILTGLLVANYIISSLLLGSGQPKSVTLAYNVFIQQVSAGNVTSITSTGDSITGVTKKPVADVSGTGTATDFSTQRPSFATDNLEALLAKDNVTIRAENPNPPTPLWESLLLGFGPTRLGRVPG
jgi:cell division protease FtsH